MRKKRLAFGSWPSPISASLVASSGSGYSALPCDVQADETGVYWIEPRPEEAGRYVIQRLDPSGLLSTCTPAEFSVSTRVHEYGGGAYLLWKGTLIFSNESDQRLYRQEPGRDPHPITPIPEAGEQLRFANGSMAPDGKFMVYVCERHTADGMVHNFLVSLSSDGSRLPFTLHAQHDFYANPRVSPDGNRLIWLTWDHPQMPWDGTELWLADLLPDGLGPPALLAGGVRESIFQPEWDPSGEVLFVSDRTGWWNLYRWTPSGTETLTDYQLEFGEPLWTLDDKTYILLDDGRIIARYKAQGLPGIAIVDPKNGSFEQLAVEYNFIGPSLSATPDQRIWFLAGSPFEFPGLSCLQLKNRKIERVIEVRTYDLDRSRISIPEQISFDSATGGQSFAYYYPPTHPELDGLEDELPPLIVMGHGGPTAATRPYLNLEVQFWTTRGFSVVDVDYSGSTGYGRAYRERLRGQWGIADIGDCVQAALHLADQGLVDRQRLLITGGSAGGYIVLCALTGYDIFRAGASYYGVADIVALAQISHKFEAKYDVSMIGPYPECADEYYQRSPIHHAENLKCPVILFQGLEDKVVPPSQSEIFVAALKKKGIYHEYISFEGEGHGFRRSENIKTALEAELTFYRKVLQISNAGS